MDGRAGEAEIERLLSHSEWLTHLARRLVRDPAEADDLVQDTWHAALRAPRAALASERGWLATLIANLARARARSAGARRERERGAAALERIDGPDALVERAEAQRRLLSHVLALEDPYRSTLLARFVEGRTPAEIARSSGVNESTVRTRLARALERLRTRLAGEERRDPLLGLGALLAPAAAGKAATAAASAATGAWIMSTGTKLAAAAVIALCAWLAWGRFADGSRPAAVEGGELAQTPALVLPTEEAPSGESSRRALEPPVAVVAAASVAAPSVPPDDWLEIELVRDGAPLVGTATWLVPESNAGWRHPQRTFTLLEALAARRHWPDEAPRVLADRTGIARFEGLPPAIYLVALDPSSQAEAPTRFASGTISGVRTKTRHKIELGSAAVHGQVFDEGGVPRVGVGVLVAPSRGWSWRQGLGVYAVATTDARGEYRIDELWATDYGHETTGYDVVMDPEGGFDGRGDGTLQKKIDLRKGQELRVDFGSATPGPRWAGRLLNRFEESFPGSPRLSVERGPDSLRVQVGAEGKFRFPCEPGTWRVRAFATGCPEDGFDLGEFEVPRSDFTMDLVVPGTRVHGKLAAAKGAPQVPRDVQLSFRPKGHDYPAAFRHANVLEDGTYVIDGLPAGEWVVGVYPGKLESPIEIVIPEGSVQVRQDVSWMDK